MLSASLSTGPPVSGSMGSSGVLQSQTACFRHPHSASTHNPPGNTFVCCISIIPYPPEQLQL